MASGATGRERQGDQEGRTGRLRVHVENAPETSPVETVTPARFRAAAGRVSRLTGRIAVTYASDPAVPDARARSAAVLLVTHSRLGDLAVRAPRVRWIQSTSAGVEKAIPFVPPGVALTNASGVHGPKGGEYALTALLMLNHRVPHFVTRQRESRWDPAYSSRIAGKTLVIVGLGSIGTAVARLARRFGLRVRGVRRTGRPHRGVDEMYGPAQLGTALSGADFVVITTPLTAETRGLIGRRELDRLPRHAGLVNLGRGPVVDCDALADKLRRGELAGAVLDVLPEEPLPPESPLWSTPNLIISPHCAVDDATDYVARALDIFFDNLRRYLAGRPLRNRVDPALGY